MGYNLNTFTCSGQLANCTEPIYDNNIKRVTITIEIPYLSEETNQHFADSIDFYVYDDLATKVYDFFENNGLGTSIGVKGKMRTVNSNYGDGKFIVKENSLDVESITFLLPSNELNAKNELGMNHPQNKRKERSL